MNKIYIVTRLFNINDRLASLELCNTIDRWIIQGELGNIIEKCFLPYRDSNQKVQNKKNKTQEIFNMDCDAISNSAVLIGDFDGPIYDSGISFELGYAYTKGIPIILLSTDYFYKRTGKKKFSINRLVCDIAKVIHISDSKNSVNDYKKTCWILEDKFIAH